MKVRDLSAVVLFVLGCALMTGGLVRADDGAKLRSNTQRSDETMQKRVAMRLETLATKLDLTEDQKTTLRPILAAEAQEMRALRTNTKLTPESQQEALRSIHERYRDQIRAVLTFDQQTRLDELRQEARAKLSETEGQRKKGRVPVTPDVD